AVDARSDLFALGIILYEIGTGRRPFAGSSTVEIASSILRDEPEPIRRLRPDLPAAFERIVSECLEKRPERRVATARDVHDALRRPWTSESHAAKARSF